MRLRLNGRRSEKAIKLLPTLEGNSTAQDDFVALVLSLLEHSTLDKTEGLPQVRKQSGSELLTRLSAPTLHCYSNAVSLTVVTP